MEVSFIIPLYNCLALTQACIASLQASLPRGLAHEIILVDDGSTDGTRDWLRGLGEPFRVVLNERNLGYATANNRGAALARGRLLALLNNDLVLARGWLEPMLAVHRRLRQPGVVGNVQRNLRTGRLDHTGIIFDHRGKAGHDTAYPLLAALLRGYRRVPAVTGACLLVAAERWRALGGFDPGYLNGGEDVDLCLRALAAGGTNAVALRSVVLHHVSASPGRKRRDEENSRRLTLRWRREIADHAVRAWARQHLATQWSGTRRPDGAAAALGLLAYLLHLRSTAPALARRGIEQAIAAELARWDEVLGPLP